MPRDYVSKGCYISPEEGKEIREILSRTGLGPSAIARKLGLKVNAVGGYMRGLTNPTPKVYYHIKEVFGDGGVRTGTVEKRLGSSMDASLLPRR
jgi:hypothetical protein